MLYQITNTESGLDLGAYEGETEQDALDAMARDAGYRDHEHACEVTDSDGSELLLQAGQYEIRCDDCHAPIGRTDSVPESAAGGFCKDCRR